MADPTSERLRFFLSTFQRAGFDCVEVNIGELPFIIGGETRPRYIEYFKGLLSEFPFDRSAHVGMGLDIRSLAARDLHRLVLASSIEVSAALDMNPLVLHYDERSKIRPVEDHFVETHREAARHAAGLGITLCIENIETEAVDPVIDFIEAVGHESLRMTLDVGHAYLSSLRFGEDFGEFLCKARPWTAHIHLNDNTGRFEPSRVENRPLYDSLSIPDRMSFGRGDIHVPPFWGKVPFDELFSTYTDYQGKFICEYYSPYFLELTSEIRAAVESRIKIFRDGAHAATPRPAGRVSKIER